MFKHQIRMTYRDVTVGNHIYYSRYLDFLEMARNEFFRDLGHPLILLQEKGWIFPVVECSLRYLRPARYDEVLEIGITVKDLGKAQFTLEYQIQRNEDLILTGITRHAVTNLEEKPVRMPSDLHSAIQALLWVV